MKLSRLISSAVIAVFVLGALPLTALTAPLELTLEDSISLALKNSPRIKAVDAEKEQAKWELAEAKGRKGFSLNYSGLDSRTNQPPSYLPTLDSVQPYNYISHELTLALPLYTGGKLENAISAQKLGSRVADLSLETSKQNIKLEASTTFYQVLEAKDLMKVARDSVGTLTRHLGNVQKLFDEGVVAKADVLRVKVQVSNAQTNLIKAENGYELAVYQLNYVMGLPLNGELEPKAELKAEPYPLNMDECIVYALKHRLELEQAQDVVKIADAQIKIAKGDQLPSLSLIGKNAWNDTSYPGTEYRHWTVALLSQWDVFDSGVTNSKIKKANAAKTAANERARDIEDKVRLEVSQSYLNLIEAKKRIDTCKVAVEEAETDYDVAEKRYSNGIGINLDVIDAELALNTAKTNYVKAMYDYNVNRAKLDKALGVKVE